MPWGNLPKRPGVDINRPDQSQSHQISNILWIVDVTLSGGWPLAWDSPSRFEPRIGRTLRAHKDHTSGKFTDGTSLRCYIWSVPAVDQRPIYHCTKSGQSVTLPARSGSETNEDFVNGVNSVMGSWRHRFPRRTTKAGATMNMWLQMDGGCVKK